MYFGCDYYPEHWPKERRKKDVQLMAEAGFNVVRMAEFAWSKIEPSEGEFDFLWLDEAINLLQNYGIKVVLGTPTAAPPAWIIEDDPTILPVDEKRLQMAFGGREHYCPNHTGYQKHTIRIVKEMGKHFKDNPCVIGWQIDNEFSGRRCYCNYCRQAFQKWLKDKYISLDNLNKEWGTIFWSQNYSKWEEIPVPIATALAHNPGLHLDYYRFISDSWINYQKLQINMLRQYIGEKQFITNNLHNSMSTRRYNGIDYSKLSGDLDFISWDNYPLSSYQVETSSAAAAADLARGIGGSGFWIMEQQAGTVGWDTMAATPEPGQLRLWSYQAIARGANSIVFFRWRTCRFGTEQYWHGILDHHGQAGHRYEEIKKFVTEMRHMGEEIVPEGVPSSVAILKDYHIHWAFEIQPNSDGMDYEREIRAYHKVFYELNITTDIITPREKFQDYTLLIVPNLYLVNNELAERLKIFAEKGGTLVFSYRSGVKEARNNIVVNAKLPGLLRELVGAEVEEYTPLENSPFGEPIIGVNAEKNIEIKFISLGLVSVKGKVGMWADKLKPDTAKVIAVYQNGIFAEQPAITINKYGKGNVVYVGTSLSPYLQKVLGQWLASETMILPALNTPLGVEAIWRGKKEVLYLLNHRNTEVNFPINNCFKELISGREIINEVRLNPYGVNVLRPM